MKCWSIFKYCPLKKEYEAEDERLRGITIDNMVTMLGDEK
jgi:hypothetical protein